MKYFLISILFLLPAAFASEEKTKFNQLSVDKTMEQLLEIEGVDKLYKGCQSSYAESINSSDYASQISSCLWQAVQGNEKLKNQVTEAYTNLKKKEIEGATKDNESARSPSSESNTLAAKKLNLTVSTAEDPAILALSEFYAKKLDAVLNPQTALTKAERDAGTIAVVDHRKYIELYKSALGKTIINAFTSYCLETGPECANDPVECDPSDDKCEQKKFTCLLPKDADRRLENRQANLANLASGNINLEGDSEESRRWQRCIVEVTPICTESDHEHSKKQACIIVDYVKSARENLKLTDEQITFYDDLNKKYKDTGFNHGFKVIGNDPEASGDAIGTITSKDIKDSLAAVDEKAMAEMDACLQQDKDGNASIVDAEACKQFLNINKEESTLALSEFELRQNIQADSLGQELEDDKKLENYLVAEGYTKEEIENLLKDPNSISLVRKKIIDRFNNEKQALIAEMKTRIESKTSAEDGKVTDKDIDNLVKIKNELGERTTDLASSIQFNNIVSSYLGIENKDGSVERNVASLFAEVKNMDEDEGRAFQKKLDDAKLVNKKSTVDLSLTVLNNLFLGYKDKKDMDDKKSGKK